MATAALTIDADVMSAIVSKAILEGIDTETRNLLIEQAVRTLVTPVKPPGAYSSTPATTPLQDAFERAVGVACNKVAYEIIEGNEEFLGRIRALVNDTLAAAMESDWDLKSEVNAAITRALLDRRERR